VKWARTFKKCWNPHRGRPNTTLSSSRCRRRVSSSTCSPTNTISACTSFQTHLQGAGLAEILPLSISRRLAVTTALEGRECLADPEVFDRRIRGGRGGRRRQVAGGRAHRASPDTGEQLAQGLISNAVDFSTGLQVATFPTVSKAIQHHTFTAASFPSAIVTGGRLRSISTTSAPLQQSEVPLGDQLSD